MKITFETKCYHQDWEFLIKGSRLEKMIDNCNYTFDKRILYINNFKEYSEIKRKADGLVKKNIIDEYYVVEDYADEALRFFDIDKSSFNGGYYYSIAELVSLYLCTTDYLLHFSSDSILEKNDKDWINEAITAMQIHPDIIVANPVWNNNYNEARTESFAEDEKWYYAYGFSDQCYLIKSSIFKKQIYNETNPASARYPDYGGELFEKRVDAYMRNNNLKRITRKDISYLHQNFPKTNKFLNYLRLKF